MDESVRATLAAAKRARQELRRESKRRRAESVDVADPDARRELFASSHPYATHLGVSTPDGDFIVSTLDGGVGEGLFIKRSRPEFRVLRRSVSAVRALGDGSAVDGRQFVDVGANIGTEVVCALRTHGFGSAVCCEPSPDNIRLLRVNLLLNELETRVRTLQVAASDVAGEARFVTLDDRSGAGWIAADDVLEQAQQRRAALLASEPDAVVPEMRVSEVSTTTLDLLCEEAIIRVEEAGMLWVDTEGHEAHVLAGAELLVSRGVPAVVEFDPMGLVRRGDRDRLFDIVRDNYTHFLDVRRGRGSLEPAPIVEIASHADRLMDPNEEGSSFTDLLFMRLEL